MENNWILYVNTNKRATGSELFDMLATYNADIIALQEVRVGGNLLEDKKMKGGIY